MNQLKSIELNDIELKACQMLAASALSRGLRQCLREFVKRSARLRAQLLVAEAEHFLQQETDRE